MNARQSVLSKTPKAFTAITLGLALSITTGTGCQSSGSKWAWWNPMSKSTEDVSLAARTAPELPSDQATPVVEGTESLGGSTTALAAAKPSPSSTGDAPAFTPGVVAKSETTPEQEAAQIASTPGMPKTPSYTALPKYEPSKEKTTPATSLAAKSTDSPGPYDPNAYKPQAPVQVASASRSTTGGRYGGSGDRYGAVQNPSAYDSLPPITTQPSPASTGDRYAGNRYATSSPEPVTSSSTNTFPKTDTAVQQTAGAVPAYPTTSSSTKSNATLKTDSLPAPPVTPADVTPLTATSPSSQTTPSVYGASVPQMAAAPTAESVKIATRPGEYRPGGTRTYSTTGENNGTVLR